METGTRRPAQRTSVAYALRLARATIRARTGAREPFEVLEILVSAIENEPVPPLMGASEAARALGVRVANLRKQVGLPVPRAHLASGPVWLAAEITEFAEERRVKREGEHG